MKIKDVILETGDKIANYEVVEQTDSEFIAKFHVEPTNYLFQALDFSQEYENTGSEGSLWIILVADTTNSDPYGINTSSNSGMVISTVTEIFKEFYSKYHPDAIAYNADRKSREKLYARVMNRILPSWKAYESHKLVIYRKQDQ